MNIENDIIFLSSEIYLQFSAYRNWNFKMKSFLFKFIANEDGQCLLNLSISQKITFIQFPAYFQNIKI